MEEGDNERCRAKVGGGGVESCADGGGGTESADGWRDEGGMDTVEVDVRQAYRTELHRTPWHRE